MDASRTSSIAKSNRHRVIVQSAVKFISKHYASALRHISCVLIFDTAHVIAFAVTRQLNVGSTGTAQTLKLDATWLSSSMKARMEELGGEKIG